MIDPEVTKFFQDIVAEIIRQREDNGIKKHDFIDQLIELKESQFFKEERLASSEIGIHKLITRRRYFFSSRCLPI